MWFGRAPAIVKKLAKSIGYSMVLAVGSSVCLPGYEFIYGFGVAVPAWQTNQGCIILLIQRVCSFATNLT
jgi:hypothetical protein